MMLVLLVSTCGSNEQFDEDQWDNHSDRAFPPSSRVHMVKDLTTNRRLVGLKYTQLIKLLGAPDAKDTNSLLYNVEIDYGSDIDPIYTKDLEFNLSRDSIVTSFKIVESKK